MLFIPLSLLLGVAAVAQTPPPSAPPPPVGEEMRVKAEDIDKLMADGKVVFLDVRDANELEEFGTLAKHIHIPLGQLESRLSELPKNKAILTA